MQIFINEVNQRTLVAYYGNSRCLIHFASKARKTISGATDRPTSDKTYAAIIEACREYLDAPVTFAKAVSNG